MKPAIRPKTIKLSSNIIKYSQMVIFINLLQLIDAQLIVIIQLWAFH